MKAAKKDQEKTPYEILIDRIKGHVIERDGHWEWVGAGMRKKNRVSPVMAWDGERVMVRRQIMILQGKDLDGKSATYGCSNPLCVHPSHMRAMTRTELRLRDAETRNYMDPAVRTKQQKAKCKIPDEVVTAIRESSGSIKATAKEMGVSQFAVWAIRNNKVRADLTSPLAIFNQRRRGK